MTSEHSYEYICEITHEVTFFFEGPHFILLFLLKLSLNISDPLMHCQDNTTLQGSIVLCIATRRVR